MPRKLGLFLLFLLPGAASLGSAACTNILYIGDNTGFNDSTVVNALTCMGYTVTQIDSGNYNSPCTQFTSLGGLNQYCQVWDNRFSGGKSGSGTDTISPCEMLAYQNYLAQGGSLYLDGENEAFHTRNDSLIAFMNTVDKVGNVGSEIIDCGSDYSGMLNPNSAILAAAGNFGTNPAPVTNNSFGIHCPGGFPVSVGSGLPVVVNGTGSALLPLQGYSYMEAYGCKELLPPYNAGKMFVYMDSISTSWGGMGNSTCPVTGDVPLWNVIQNIAQFLEPRPATNAPEKQVAPDTGYPNDTFSYTFFYTNMGTQDNNTCITDSINTDLALVSSVPAATALGGNQYQWCFGTVNTCDTISISVSMQVTNGAVPGVKPNTFVVSSTAKANRTSNNAPYTVLAPAVTITKAAQPGTVAAGATVTYTLFYKNNATQKSPITNDPFTGPLSGWTNLNGTPTSTGGTWGGATSTSYKGFNFPDLTTQAQIVVTDAFSADQGLIVQAQPGGSYYEFSLTASGTGTPDSDLLFRYYNGSSFTTLLTISNFAAVGVGTYQMKVVNTGCNYDLYWQGTLVGTVNNCTLTNGYSGLRTTTANRFDNFVVSSTYRTGVVVTDGVPVGLTYVPGSATSCTGTVGYAAPTLTWSVGNLAPGASCTVTYLAWVSGPVTSGQVIPNTARVDTDQEPFYDSNNAPVTVSGFIPSPTRTPTYSPSATATRTLTWSPTASWTPTWSPSFTASYSATPTPTRSPTPTWTPTSTLTLSPTQSFTKTWTSTFTATSTPTFSVTYTPTFTVTPTATPTWTYTWSPTRTRTRTPTPTWTPTSTPTFSASPTPTYTASPTWTQTFTYTFSPTRSYTATWTPTFTFTNTPTFSVTFTPTYTWTKTSTPTWTFTSSPTRTWTRTETPTFSPSATPTYSASPTATPSWTPTWTNSSTHTPLPTLTFTPTASPTYTPSATPTWSPTRTWTPTNTNTFTPSATPTFSASPTGTFTWTRTATPTWTPSWTSTWTPTSTWSPTNTWTRTATLTWTPTSTPTYSATPTWTTTWTPTDTNTSTHTPLPTLTFTRTNTPTSTWTLTATPSASPTYSTTPTSTYTWTPTFTVTMTWTPTWTSTNSMSPTFTFSWTPTSTWSPTWTWTRTATPTFTSTSTPTYSATPTHTPTWTPTATDTSTHTPLPTLTFTRTPTGTASVTPTSTVTPSWTPTWTSTNSMSPTHTSTVTSTSTDSPTATSTPTPTWTPTWTPTATPSASPTFSTSPTATSTDSPTETDSPTSTWTPTDTPTFTDTPTSTPTWTATDSMSPTHTSTDSPTSTWTPTNTATPTPTDSPTATPSWTPTDTPKDTQTSTDTPTWTLTWTRTATATDSMSPTDSTTATPSWSPSLTATPSASPTDSMSPTHTSTDSPTSSWTPTPTPTATPSATSTASATTTPSPTSTPTATPSATYTWTPTKSATLTASPSRTPSTTFSPTPQDLVKVSVKVFNEAGEQVAVITDSLILETAINEFFLESGGLLDDANPSLLLVFPDAGSGAPMTLAWGGLDSSGQPLANGSYVVRVESVDSSGVATVITGTATLLRSQSLAKIRIYNEAGELVYSQNLPAWGLKPSGVEIKGTVLDPSLAAGSPGSQLGIQLGSLSLSWNGKDSAGNVLANGEYLVEIELDQGDSENLITATVTILSGGASEIGQLSLNPNPIAGTRTVEIRVPSNSLGGTLRIYTVSGELARRADFSGDSAFWDLKDRTGSPVSAGLYLILAESRASDGSTRRSIGRLVVLR